MARVGLLLTVAFGSWAYLVPASAQAPAGVTVFEGARLIVGDGRAAIENAAFVVDGGRFTQVGRAGDVKAPAGAARVSLSGKTVMPALIDTHTHLSRERAPLIDDLQRRPYYGVAAAMSLGQDPGDLAFQVRSETIPGAARFRTAGRGITAPEPGRTDIPYWIASAGRGPQGGSGTRGQEGRYRQDLGRRSKRHVQETHARPVRRRHRRGAQA